jgi:aminomethyltransferase
VLRRTPLWEEHRRLGGRLVEFAGWEMPVQYEGVLAEHRAVRSRAGLFDVSHMGELVVRGPAALGAVQRAVTNDASPLAVGAAMYTPMCYPDGGTVDDLIVYRTGETEYLLIVNAANADRDREWLRGLASGLDAEVADESDAWALLALQGPLAAAILGGLAGDDLSRLRPFRFRQGVPVAGRPCTVARTGYTGEDGFEILCPAADAPAVWRALLDDGRPVPCGLGARDTLRLEAALPLYGHELSPEINPLEARLGPFVKLEKGDFVGREALQRVRAEGPRRRLCGLVLLERAVARAGYPVRPGGRVTSGTFSPTLERSIALALVPADPARPGSDPAPPGSRLAVEVRGRDVPADVVKLPFYRRAPAGGPAGA